MSSSFFRLSQFLKEHGHDIIDMWISEERIDFVRIISRESGHLFFIGVQMYDISISTEDRSAFPNHLYYIEEAEEENNSLENMSELLKQGFSEIHSHSLCFEGCFFQTNWDKKRYTVRNLPESDRKGFYLYFPLEWLFENKHVLHFEVQKRLHRFQMKIDRSIQQFIPQYKMFLTKQEQDMIQELSQQRRWSHQELGKWQLLFQQVCKKENGLCQDIQHYETVLEASDLTFQETIRRGHQLKNFHSKFDKCVHLRKKIAIKLLFLYQQQWNAFLPFLITMDRCAYLLQEFKKALDAFRRMVPTPLTLSTD